MYNFEVKGMEVKNVFVFYKKQTKKAIVKTRKHSRQFLYKAMEKFNAGSAKK